MQVPKRRMLADRISINAARHLAPEHMGAGSLLTEAPAPALLAGVRSGAPDNAEWLAQTVESALQPEIEIVDPHHHLWDDVEPGYALNEFLSDTNSGHNVVQTVFVESGWGWDSNTEPELKSVPEVRLASAAAEESERRGGTRIGGVVGFLDMRNGAACARALEALQVASQGRLVGVRDRTAWDSDPAIPAPSTGTTAGAMRAPGWRTGFAQLAQSGLTYDAWLYHPQLADLADLAASFPDTQVVLDHLGVPLGVGRYGLNRVESFEEWKRQMRQVAAQPNVNVKLGGIGMPLLGGEWHRGPRPPSSDELADSWRPHILWCIETFGVDRCMFESNFPVDRCTASYVILWNTFKRIVADGSIAEKAALFAGTARATYGI